MTTEGHAGRVLGVEDGEGVGRDDDGHRIGLRHAGRVQSEDRPESLPEDEGGDAACWLERVCPDCGAFVERDQAHDCPAAD